jgi:hypothetical protein
MEATSDDIGGYFDTWFAKRYGSSGVYVRKTDERSSRRVAEATTWQTLTQTTINGYQSRRSTRNRWNPFAAVAWN